MFFLFKNHHFWQHSYKNVLLIQLIWCIAVKRQKLYAVAGNQRGYE